MKTQMKCTDVALCTSCENFDKQGYLNAEEKHPTVLVTRARIFNHPTGWDFRYESAKTSTICSPG